MSTSPSITLLSRIECWPNYCMSGILFRIIPLSADGVQTLAGSLVSRSTSEAKRLQRTRAGALEEPACADLEAMMPGWEARGVEGEACAACEWAAEGLSSGEDG